MSGRRGRPDERESPNPRPRRQSRSAGPDGRAQVPPNAVPEQQGADTADPQAPEVPPPPPAQNVQPGFAVDNIAMQQLLAYLQQQQQVFQVQMTAQMQANQAQMQQTQAQFERMLQIQGQGTSKKKEPPIYEGKLNEDIELWIFATEEYYSNRRTLMEANTSEFVSLISSNLGTSVMNWYRAFATQCTATNIPRTWNLFKQQLRARYRPRDFEFNLRERLFDLKQIGTFHEYTTKFQDLLSQTELHITEMEKRFYFQNGLRSETQSKIKEHSPGTLAEAIEIASNFEFAHFSGKPVRATVRHTSTPYATSAARKNFTPSKPSKATNEEKKPAPKKWNPENVTCHTCGQKGHISPKCPQRKAKEANHYVSGSFYASLEVKAKAFKSEDKKTDVSIFIDNGCSLYGISPELAKSLNLDIHEDISDMLEVDLGFGQTILRPRRTAEMTLHIPGFPVLKRTFQIMPIPEDKDVILGMIWLREQNPEIDWKSLKLKPRAVELNETSEKAFDLLTPSTRPARFVGKQRVKRLSQSREIFNYYCQNGHDGPQGHTDLISIKKFAKELRKGQVECVFLVNPHESEKAERFKQQGWDALKDNPAFEVLWKRKDTVFRTELPSTTPPVREGIEHEIELKPGTKSIHVPQWRQSPDQKKVIQEWTQEMVKAGIIRPSTSPFSAPTFCVKKPVGWRIVHDFRRLNAATILPAIPMPRKEDTFDAMSGSYWFSCMDLLWGYYQVKLRESDIPFTAFSTPDGLFEYLVTPMGLSGSPGTFNRLLQKVFSDLRDCMRIYFDDIYVFTTSTDIQEHLEALDRVLQRCEDQQLYIKLSKCQFCVDEIPCLGDFVGRNGVRMDPDKVNIISNWPIPQTKKQMESFLGTTVYVSRFCKDFAQFAGPLHECIKGKRQKDNIELTEHQLECFRELKRRLTTPPVLRLPDFTKPFGIRMDASNFAIGGVLFQKEGGLEYPIAFTGRKMKSAELNYPVREQELLAIMHALKVWRVYLLDRPFIVETDHKSIETILTQKTTNRRVARWFNELAEFQPQFKWIPGNTNDVADALSRNPDFEHKAAQVSLKELLKAAEDKAIVASVQVRKMSIHDMAKKAYVTDERTRVIMEKLLGEETVPKYSITDGLLYYQTREDEEQRLVIPDNEDLKNRVIFENHDVVTSGHPGYFKTFIGVQRNYYWPKMSKYIQRYVRSCEQCQRTKARQMKPPGLLNPLDIPCGRWVDISMDFLVSLPQSEDGDDAIIVIVDRLTKRAKFIATSTKATAEQTANLFMKHYVRDHGLPKTIVSDRDSKFTSKFWTSLVALSKTQHKLSSAFRPQTDGQTERTNRFLEDYLRGIVNPNQDNWKEFLHLAEIAYNRRQHSSIGMSPFEADLGYVPYMPDDIAADPEFKKMNISARNFLIRQEAILKMAQDAMSEAQERMKAYYDKNRLRQDFQIGDLVLLDGKNLDIRHKGYAKSKKLAPRFIGPFPIIRKVNKDSYELKLSKGLRLHPVFHTSLLKAYVRDEKRTQEIPKVILADGSEGQLIHKVLDHRKRRGKDQYKIQWLGETEKQATWEPVEDLKQIPGLIEEYWKQSK